MYLLAGYAFKVAFLERRRAPFMYLISAIILVPVTFESFNIQAISNGSPVVTTDPTMFLFGFAAVLLNVSFAILEIIDRMPDVEATLEDSNKKGREMG